METNSAKIQKFYSLMLETHKAAEEDRRLCDNFFESHTKQGSIAGLAYIHLQKQFTASGYFCDVLNKRIGLLGGEASRLTREDREVMSKFEAIVEMLANKKCRKTTLYDYANVEEGYTNEAKKEILEMEKFSKTLETMKLTVQTLMSELTKVYGAWNSIWKELSLIILNPNEVYNKSYLIMKEKIQIEIAYEHTHMDDVVQKELVDSTEKQLESIVNAAQYIKTSLENCHLKEEKFKSFFNQGNNLSDFLHYYLEDCHYFYRITNQLAVKLNAHYYGYNKLFGTIRENTAKYSTSLDAFDKWTEEYERKTASTNEMKRMIQECENKLKEMTQIEVEKRELFQKEYAKFLPEELMVECPIPEIVVHLNGKSRQKKRFCLREGEDNIYHSYESSRSTSHSRSRSQSYSQSHSHSDSDSLNDELLSNS
jgi:hypothetical protein